MKSSFVDYVVNDLLGNIKGVRARRMFGGYGIYKDDTMFSLIAEDELYYKVGKAEQKDYEAHGSEPFRYATKDRSAVTMSYWKLPTEVMEDHLLLKDWTHRAIQTALAAKKNARAVRRK